MKIILFFNQTIETNSFFLNFSQKFFSKVDFGHLFLSIFQNPKKVLEKHFLLLAFFLLGFFANLVKNANLYICIVIVYDM